MAETDSKDPQGNLPTDVGFRNIQCAMWSYPPTAVNSNYENITLGMDGHLCKDPKYPKDASPVVVFKASTVLQSLGIIASRTLLSSSDVQGESKGRSYCPTTWNYAYPMTPQLNAAIQLPQRQVQPTVQPQVPVKAAPAARAPSQASASSSMSGGTGCRPIVGTFPASYSSKITKNPKNSISG